MFKTETSPVSDSDFNALVASAVAAGERLFYTVQSPDRRAYLVALLAGNNSAEIRLVDQSSLQDQIDAANKKAADAVADKAKAEQSAKDAAAVIPHLQQRNEALNAQVSSLTDQLAQAKLALADVNNALAQEQAKSSALSSQLNANQPLADLVKELRG